MKKFLVLALALAALTVLLAPAVLAAPEAPNGWVYSNNDAFGQNTISVFKVTPPSTIAYVTTVNSGAGQSGSGGGYYGHDIIDGCGDNLFVANSSSNSVSTFSGRSTGNLKWMKDTSVDAGTLSLNVECGQAKGGPIVVLLSFSDSGTMNSYTMNTDGSLKKVSGYSIGSVDGADAGVSAKKAYYAASVGFQLVVATVNPSTGALGTPVAYNTSGGGDLAAGVSDDPMGRGWYIGWANGSGTLVDYCANMATPTCKLYTIGGGGVNSNTLDAADGKCLYVGNQWTNTIIATTVAGDGSPSTAGVAASTLGSVGTPGEFVNPKTKALAVVLVPTGPDNDVTVYTVGSNCALTMGGSASTNDFNGWLMSIDETAPGNP